MSTNPLQGGSPTIHAVRFAAGKSPVGRERVTPNTLRLVGEGTARVEGGVLVLQGRKRSAFGISDDTEQRFPLECVHDVEQHGDALAFAFDAREGERRGGAVLLWAGPAAVAALAAALPVRQSAGHAPSLSAEAQFEQELRLATPRVWVVPGLILLNCAVFLLMVRAGAGWFDVDGAVHVEWGSNLGTRTIGGEWYRLLTSTALHFGVIHLLLNMYVLFSAGRIVERMFGPGRFLFIYLAAGVAGSLVSITWDPWRNSAGASGAIFGVYGALAAFLLVQRGRVPVHVLRNLATSAAVFTLYSLANGMAHAGIDNAAHVGGLVGGFLVALPLVVAVPRPASSRRTRIATGVAVSATVAVLSMAAWGLQAAHAPMATWREMARLLEAFPAGEDRTIDRFNAVVEQSRQGKIDDAHLADVIEHEVLPYWVELAGAAAALQPPTLAGDRERYDFLRDFSANRRDAFTMMMAGLRAGDLEKVKAGSELLARGEALMGPAAE
jgi:rhomboid protease GluP